MPPLHTAAGVLYLQVKRELLRRIEAREWKPAEALPNERTLAAQLQVSIGTLRRAVDELVHEHVLMRRQGKGTFVATHSEQQVQYRFLKLVPDQGNAQQEGPAERSIVECKRMRAHSDVARALGLRSGDPVLQVRRVLAFSGKPTILEDLWLPGTPFKGLTAERLRDHRGATYALYETEFGVRMLRAEEQIRAVLPDAEQARLLGVTSATPLLSVERVAFTYNDTPMELRRALYRTDTHHYKNTLN